MIFIVDKKLYVKLYTTRIIIKIIINLNCTQLYILLLTPYLLKLTCREVIILLTNRGGLRPYALIA